MIIVSYLASPLLVLLPGVDEITDRFLRPCPRTSPGLLSLECDLEGHFYPSYWFDAQFEKLTRAPHIFRPNIEGAPNPSPNARLAPSAGSCMIIATSNRFDSNASGASST
jgi:hypothetical protein